MGGTIFLCWADPDKYLEGLVGTEGKGEEADMAKRQPIMQDKPLNTDLQQLVDCQEDELLVVDTEYRITYVNSAMLRNLPPETGSPIGRQCYEVLEGREDPCRAPLWLCPLEKVLLSDKSAVIVHSRKDVDADAEPSRYVKITLHPIKDEHGNIYALAEVRRDVSAERELESQIVRHHHHLKALSRISTAVSELWDLDTILGVSLDAVLEIVNGEIGGILLFDSQNHRLSYRVYRGLSARYAEKMRLKVGEGIAGRVAETGEPILLEDVSKDPRVAHRDLVSTEGLKGFASVPLKTKDKVVGVLNVASHLTGGLSEDDLYLLSSIGHQIGIATEHARLYDRLAKARERYRVLLRHALTAQEEERRRIARELHDETSQALTSLALSLQAIIGMAEMKDIEDDALIEKLRKTHDNTVNAGVEIVKLMKELRPTLLDELGMPAAIRRYAKDTLESQGINVATEFSDPEERFRPELEVALFRIAQGLIGNILEHSEARNAVIKLDCDTSQCVLRISDDGKGFDVNKLTRVDSSGRGAGLFTIKERVGLVGGHCRINSRPGEGTQVKVTIPVARDADYEDDQGADS
ncbi:GAF domain-containing protein [Chloroflexota bacterium]